MSRVTARLSGATSEAVTLTVSAAAVAPATSSDFVLSANRELRIAAGQTTSTDTVTMTAVDNGEDHADREVRVTATVRGPSGVAAPSARTLTIADDEGAPTVTLVLTPEEIIGGRWREPGDGAPERCDERGGDADGVGGGGGAGDVVGLRVEREPGAPYRGRADDEHGHGDDDGGGQRGGPRGPGGSGDGDGAGPVGRGGALGPYADDRRRRGCADGDAGADAGGDYRRTVA